MFPYMCVKTWHMEKLWIPDRNYCQWSGFRLFSSSSSFYSVNACKILLSVSLCVSVTKEFADISGHHDLMSELSVVQSKYQQKTISTVSILFLPCRAVIGPDGVTPPVFQLVGQDCPGAVCIAVSHRWNPWVPTGWICQAGITWPRQASLAC